MKYEGRGEGKELPWRLPFVNLFVGIATKSNQMLTPLLINSLDSEILTGQSCWALKYWFTARLGPKTKISALFRRRTKPEVWFRLWRRLPIKGTVIVYEDLFLR